MNPRIYIIGFNSQKRMVRAFNSIPERYQRILIDNGNIALKAPPGVECFVTGPGMFTSAFNWALRDAMDHDSIPIICNDDIVFEDGCIELLLAEIEKGAGLACPVQVDMALPNNIIMGGTHQCFPAGIHRTGIRGKHYLRNCDYPWLPFCVVALNPEVVREIGYPDANLKMWFSDSDYSIRVRATGRSVMLVADAFVRHEQSASITAVRSDKMNHQFVMDRAYFEHKYGGQTLEECK